MNNCFLMGPLHKWSQPGWSFWHFSRKERGRDLLNCIYSYQTEYYSKMVEQLYLLFFLFSRYTLRRGEKKKKPCTLY